jgi:post-segregation antitoxin (ccd killing protein)
VVKRLNAHKLCVKKKNVTIRINSEILQQAKEQGFNISKVCENALKQKLTPKQAFLNKCPFAKENSLEPRAGFEPATSALPRQCPTS